MGMPPPSAATATPDPAPSLSPSSRRICAWVDHPGEGIHEAIPPEAISDALEHPQTRLWLDITDPEPEDTHLLLEEFGLHPLALEEITSPHTRPKCVEFDGLYVLVMYAAGRGEDIVRENAPTATAPLPGLADAAENDATLLRQVVIYIGRNYLITAHEEPFPEIDECVRRWRSQTGLKEEGVAAPLYSLLDTLVDGYFPIMDTLVERIEELEERIYEGSDEEARGPEIFRLKKVLLSLRRVLAGQRDALNLMLRQDVPVLPPSSLLFFQSVYDHLVRLVESIDTYRDLLSSAMDMHLSILSNRMNQVMKTLTAISTCLMSAALISGIYGMNFKQMPELRWQYGYPMAIGIMVVVAGGLLWYFRRIKWI